jgi:putative oxidoreductase
MYSFSKISSVYNAVTFKLDAINTWLPQLILRLLLAWEFGEAGFEKLYGTNWFADITFPFPFNLLSPEFSWNLALIFEIIGAFTLVLGLGTRIFSMSLIILTIVAILSVHWPQHWDTISELLKGYRIIDENNDGFGNYKLPLIYIVMFLPLLFGGAGKASIDYIIKLKQFK